MLGFKFAKSRGWIDRCWRSQTTGSATSTRNPTVNGVNGNAKIFRGLAGGPPFNDDKIDRRVTRLGCTWTHCDHDHPATRSF